MSSGPAVRQSHYGAGEYQPYENQDGQRVIPYNRPWHIAKIVIRGFNLASCFIAIGIFFYIASWSPYEAVFRAVGGFPAIAAVIWETSELITICARGGRKGIHPGAHVGLHLLLWLCFGVAVGIQSINIYYWNGDGDHSLEKAVTAFTVILLIGHFTLFVRACVETNELNRRPPVFMVPVNVPAPMASRMVAGSYVPYPHQSQQTYFPSQQENRQMPGANAASMDSITPPGPDGTYYGPSGQAH